MEPRAACSNGQPDGDFFAAFGSASEKQIGEIDAGQQQDEGAYRCEHSSKSEHRVPNVWNEQTGRD